MAKKAKSTAEVEKEKLKKFGPEMVAESQLPNGLLWTYHEDLEEDYPRLYQKAVNFAKKDISLKTKRGNTV